MEQLIENQNVRQTTFEDNMVERPTKRIRSCDVGGLRVKQPEELMGIPAVSQNEQSETNPAFDPSDNPDDPKKAIYDPVVDPTAKFGPRVTAQQLTRALENLQTTIRNERKSGIPDYDDTTETDPPLSEQIQPKVNYVTR
jgi:hypothetical protein